MNEFLVKIIDAHGGTDRWHWNEKVEATIVSGGGFFALKGVPQDAKPAAYDRMAARGTIVGLALWGSRSAHDVHAGADRHREARWHNGR